jgi:hypothetical protein
MKKLSIITLVALSLAVIGCGGGGGGIGPGPGGGSTNFAGRWSGPFTGDLTGDMTTGIGASGSVVVSGTAGGLGPFSGSGWVDNKTGTLNGDLGALGSFTGRLRIEDGKLKGTATFPGDKDIAFTLERQ